MENRLSSAAKHQAKMKKAIRLGARRASSTMNTDVSPRRGANTDRSNQVHIKTHFKGARSLLMQAEGSTRIDKQGSKMVDGVMKKSDDEANLDQVMGIIQNQLMSEHGEGVDPEKKYQVNRFRKFIGPETDVILTPETLTAHVLNYTNATRKRAENVPVLKKGAGFFRTI